MSALATYTASFEGRSLTFHAFRDRTCAVAAELGQALGYTEEGRTLVNQIRREWSDEAIHGKDFDVLEGDDLRDFKAVLGDNRENSLSSTARLMILYESGIDLVCLKTEKPLGKKLRRFLADEVLPKLRRGQTVGGPAASPAVQVVLAAQIQKAVGDGENHVARTLALALGKILAPAPSPRRGRPPGHPLPTPGEARQPKPADPWLPTVRDWLEGRRTTTCAEVLEGALSIARVKQKQAHLNRVGAILSGLGWTRERKMVKGEKIRRYVAPRAPAPAPAPFHGDAEEQGPPSTLRPV